MIEELDAPGEIRVWMQDEKLAEVGETHPKGAVIGNYRCKSGLKTQNQNLDPFGPMWYLFRLGDPFSVLM